MATALEHVSEETRDELARTMLAISNNPKTRQKTLQAIKEVSPNTPIPELEFEARIAAETAPLREELTKAKNSFEEFQLGTRMREEKLSVMAKHKLGAEDMTKMEEKMGKKELPMDYEFAARLYKQEMEVAPPTNYGNSGYGPFALEKNAKAFEGLMENESGWSNQTAHDIIDQMQQKGQTPAF